MGKSLIPARTYMLENIEVHRDDQTGEVCCTTLAEDTCDALNLYEEPGWTVPEWVYDLAVDVVDQHRNRHIHPALGSLVNSCPSDWF